MRELWHLLPVLLLAGSLFAADPFDGTWKANVAKSKFAGPQAAPKELTAVVEEQGDRVMVTVKGVAADGSPISVKYSVSKTGGEAATFSEGGPPPGISDVYAKKKADAHSLDATTMKDGKAIETAHSVVSGDGKTFRTITKGVDAQGKPFESVTVWERQ
jgi:hypothetical protein